MQIQLTGHNIELTDALKDFTHKKLKKLNTYLDLITNIHIVFDVNKLRQIAEAQLQCHGQVIHAQAESEDMYKTVDELLAKVTRQLQKLKEKHTDHR